MNQEHNAISIGFKLGQGVSSLNRILVSLKLYKRNTDDQVISRILNEVEALIQKLSI